ncbi:MAG: hypothetical protein J2P28_02550 [Actinobacteria bacterium]|nr:hypothetical protein [Actinomycetota bacterium]
MEDPSSGHRGDRADALIRAARALLHETVRAVNLIFEMAGSTAGYRGHPIEAAFRDINTAANHTNYAETAYAAIGSYFLTRDREGGPEIAGRPFF